MADRSPLVALGALNAAIAVAAGSTGCFLDGDAGGASGSSTASANSTGNGSAATNKALSDQRANAVKGQLAAGGVPADTISTVGMGPENPIGDNKTPAGRLQNRRVEIYLGDAMAK